MNLIVKVVTIDGKRETVAVSNMLTGTLKASIDIAQVMEIYNVLLVMVLHMPSIQVVSLKIIFKALISKDIQVL